MNAIDPQTHVQKPSAPIQPAAAAVCCPECGLDEENTTTPGGSCC